MYKQCVIAAAILSAVTGSVSAQSAEQVEIEQLRARQRIATMEAVLMRAVSNGADNVIRQVKSLVPDQPLFLGAPQAHGFRLEGYGVFFNVEVPDLRLPLMWPLRYRVLDQNRDAVRTLERLQVEVAQLPGEERERLQPALRELERQIGGGQPAALRRGVSAATVSAGVAGAPAAADVDPALVADPEIVYTREVKEALIDAMLESSGPFALGPDEWFTIAARHNVVRDPLVAGTSVDSSTLMFRVRGSDLAAFRTGQITLEEARRRVEETEQ